jgi:hypothetical protein
LRPYWKYSIYSLVIAGSGSPHRSCHPTFDSRIIDQGINQKDMRVVLTTTVIMLGLSVLQVLFAWEITITPFKSARAWRGTSVKRYSLKSNRSRLEIWTISTQAN